MANFEQEFFGYMAALKMQMYASPLYLGGVNTSGGGAGGPPGGFVGYLPQTRVTYDMTELESNATVVSATLLDNMNHIRYRLEQLESTSFASGTGHVIQNNSVDMTPRSHLDFVGATVADDAGANATRITIANGGHTIQNNGVDMTARTHLNFIGATVADDAGNDATKVTISGGISSGADILAVQVFS